MMETGTFKPFSSEMRFPLTLQALGFILTALILDGGMIFRCYIAGLLVCWGFLLLKMVDRSPVEAIDRWILHYGFLFLFPLFLFVSIFVRVLFS